MHLVGDGFVAHRAGAGEHQHRLGVAALVVDELDAAAAKAQAVTAGHGLGGVDTFTGLVAAVPGLDALVHREADGGAFQRGGQRRGMHVGAQLVLAESNGGRRRHVLVAVFQATPQLHRNALAERVLVHRMGKAEGRHQLL